MGKKPFSSSILGRQINIMDATAVLICFGVFLFWVILLTYKYYNFGYYDWDLALYAHAMWNISQGSLHSSLFGMNILGNHSNYIALLIAPIYKLWPHPLTLLNLKILSSVLGGFFLYKIAKERLNGIWGNILMVMFFILPANYLIIPHEFDFESLSVFPLFLMFYYMYKRKFIPFLLSALIVASLKENTPLILVAFGIFGFFGPKGERWKWGGIPLLIGLTVFALNIFVVIPALRAAAGSVANPYVSLYADLGGSLPDAAGNILSKPQDLISSVATPTRWKYIKDLFGPWLTPAVFSPHILFLVSPIFLQNLFSSLSSMHSIFFHYNSSITPFIFLAVINTFYLIKRTVHRVLLHIVLSILCILGVAHAVDHFDLLKNRMLAWEDHLDRPRLQLLDLIPDDASVITTFEFLNELSQRKELYPLYYVYRGKNAFTQQDFINNLPELDYALVDFEDSWIYYEGTGHYKNISPRMQNFFLNGDWKVKKAFEEVVLLEKNTEQGEQLLEVSASPPSLDNLQPFDVRVADQLSLLKYRMDMTETANYTVVPLTLLWKSLADVSDRFLLRFGLEQADGKLILMRNHEIGYTVYPTFVWKKGEYILERYWLLLPKLKSGNYKIQMVAYNYSQRKFASLTQNSESGQDKNIKIVQLGTLQIP